MGGPRDSRSATPPRVVLYEADLVGAVLTEVDGVGAWVAIRLTDVTVIIGQPGGIETDEFDLFP